MQLVIILLLSVFASCIKGLLIYSSSFRIFLHYEQFLGQITPTPNYSCNQNDTILGFTLSASSHSAGNSASDCSLQQCYTSASNTSSCLLSSTPCFDYRTLNNSRYCAPAILCSILEPCNNITYTCASTTSICIVNSCCSLQAVCLPLSTTDFCPIGNKILHIQRFRVLKNKLKCFNRGNF
jgi:hypothetical protein